MFLIMAVFLVLGGSVGGVAIYHDVTVVSPNAEAEFEEMKKYSCDQMKDKIGTGSFWSPQNSKYAREAIDTCNKLDQTLKQKVTDKAEVLGKEVFSITSAEVDVHAKVAPARDSFSLGIGILERQFADSDIPEYDKAVREMVGDTIKIEFFPLDFCVTAEECNQIKNMQAIQGVLGDDFEEKTQCRMLEPQGNKFTIECNS